MPGPTLEDLDGERWGEPTFRSSLVVTCHQLRQKPLSEFTLADFRIMINQSIGLPHLMPRAVNALEADPLVEAYGYPGDLLSAVMHADRTFLRQQPALLRCVKDVAARAADLFRPVAADTNNVVEREVLQEIEQFLEEEG